MYIYIYMLSSLYRVGGEHSWKPVIACVATSPSACCMISSSMSTSVVTIITITSTSITITSITITIFTITITITIINIDNAEYNIT